MSKFLVLAIIILLTECLLALLFAAIAQLFYHKIGFDFKSIFKGFVERLFLLIALANGYSQALTFFSALKLATRLKREDKGGEMEGFNDYYLLGNLLSVAVAIGYVYLYSHFADVPFFRKLAE